MTGLPFDVNNIFSLSVDHFDEVCMDIFRFQYQSNPVYHQWCALLGIDPLTIKTPEQIPSLPVSFFKQKKVLTG